MFKSVTIENFFSFGEAQKIELNSGVNILIGINGSGKSNFIRALRLLSLPREDEFRKLFLQEWGGFDSVAFNNNEEDVPIKITYEYDIDSFRDKIIENHPSFKLYHDLFLFKNGSSNYHIEEQTYVVYDSTNEKRILIKEVDFADIFDLSILKITLLRIFLRDLKCYEKFDVTEKSQLRKPGSTYLESFLLPNGINFYSLLNDININQSPSFDDIEKHLREVNPYFRNILSRPIGSKFLYYLKETGLKKAIDFQFISDGTLQYLLLLSIFYNPKRGKLVTLDEPDNNLHPDMINGIAKGIKHAAATGTQMIIATHSPLLLNDFELKDILIFEKDKNNQSIVNRKSIKEFEHWEGDFLIGQMWLSGQLGGVRW